MFSFKLETQYVGYLMKQELTGSEMGTWHALQNQQIKPEDSNSVYYCSIAYRRPNVIKVSIYPVYLAKPKAYTMSRASKDKMSKKISSSFGSCYR